MTEKKNKKENNKKYLH